ncbi:hypothetical protein [Hymenobacter cheonanensis]|uniref:hypothetical protein n=1 Tax=Hymenobacter sp. CA2-7 TaxID=3063993 RepID=UPI0027126FF6|nr:hypothetical protein [Hymenobacter sp. CA2-7]MDO7884342.1 hypothetical protein [Hymenobacter sp. CA2-7]
MHSFPILLLVTAIGSPVLLGHFLLKFYLQKERRIMAANSDPCVSEEVFRTLPPEIQLCVIRDEGTFLAQHQQQGGNVMLYHMQGRFFCELQQQAETQELLFGQTFTDSAPLESYLTDILISEPLEK